MTNVIQSISGSNASISKNEMVVLRVITVEQFAMTCNLLKKPETILIEFKMLCKYHVNLYVNCTCNFNSIYY